MGGWLAAWAVLLAGAGAGAPLAQVSVREDGAIQVRGEPFFPVGFIHVSSAGDDAKRSSDLRMIVAGGFNLMQAVIKPGDGAFLDEAETFGMNILAECADAEVLKAAVKEFKGKRAIVGWSLAEDADNGKRLSKEVVALRKEIKAADPGRLTYITCGDHEKCVNFFDGADVIGLKSFPLPAGHLSGPGNLFTSANRAAGETKRSFVGVIQAWAPKGSRAPTADEVRNMTYQALVQGARGILYHAYLDKDWDMGGQQDLVSGIGVVVSEIQSLRQVLLGGKLRRIDPGTADVFVGAWSFQGRITLVVVNTSGQPKKVSITLPGEAAGGGRPQFRMPAKKLVVEGTQLMGELAAADVHIYSFETK